MMVAQNLARFKWILYQDDTSKHLHQSIHQYLECGWYCNTCSTQNFFLGMIYQANFHSNTDPLVYGVIHPRLSEALAGLEAIIFLSDKIDFVFFVYGVVHQFSLRIKVVSDPTMSLTVGHYNFGNAGE